MKYICFLFIILFIGSCTSVSTFNQHAYEKTTAVKVDALTLMSIATEDYSSHLSEIKGVLVALDKVYEYEKNRPKNTYTIKLWDKLLDTSGHLFGGFIIKWRHEQKMNSYFINESKKQVGEAFDVIAQLESKKTNPKKHLK